MEFMSAATLRNMPSYLADARAKRENEQAAEALRLNEIRYQQGITRQDEGIQREEGRYQEEQARYQDEQARADLATEKQEQLKARLQKLGNEFLKHGDYTPQGIQKFAEQHEMSMPEMKGIVDMVVEFKKMEKEPQRIPNIWSIKGGKKVRVPDVAGATSDLESTGDSGSGADGLSGKVADWQKYARDTLKSSLGFSDTLGWSGNKANEKKYNKVLAETDLGMEGKPGTDVIKVLNKEINRYDSATNVADEVKKIPADSIVTSKADAKKAVDEAKEAGAIDAEIKAELKRKGWDDKAIGTILRDANPANPLGL